MKIERTKNAARNFIFGTFYTVYQTVALFIIRTVIIKVLGAEYLGLGSLFTSILQVLNLAELGVSWAMVYSMYKPIAEDDTDTICALMNLYKKYYTIIGGVILVAGLIVLPFLPRLIKGDVPPGMNIYVLYIMELAAAVSSYWVMAYKNSIIQAHQRADVSNKILTVCGFVKYTLQIIGLIVFRSYYYYVFILIAMQIVSNIATAVVADRMYPKYRAKGKLPKETVDIINSKIKDLFTTRIGNVIINSVDSVVISACLGLSVLAVYKNYYYILSAIINIVAILFHGCLAGIGNSLVVESVDKNFSDFKKFTFIVSWISAFCATSLLCIFQPFMEVWMGKELMLPVSVVVSLTIQFLVMQYTSLFGVYKDAAGIWHEDRLRPLCVSVINLILSVILVNVWGINGVVIATLVAMIIVGIPWILKNLFSTIFETHMLGNYLKTFIAYVIVTLISAGITYFICTYINLSPIVTIVVRAVVCITIPNTIFFMVFRKTEVFCESIKMLDNLTHKKLGFLSKMYSE